MSNQIELSMIPGKFAYTVMATVLMCLWASSTFRQTAAHQYQTGTILNVTRHHESALSGPSADRFDVAVQILDTVYVVLFTQPAGRISIQHCAGLHLPVLIKGTTMAFNFLGSSMELPITKQQPATPRKKP